MGTDKIRKKQAPVGEETDMVTLLAKRFVKDPGATDTQETRTAYGYLCGILGILINIVLFGIKYLAGTLSRSIAITADAFNNLSDAGSSVVTLLGFKLASKKPDPDHPFGHGRMEYLSGLIVSAVILMMGAELLKEAVDKITHPAEVDFSVLTAVILIASILGKFYMYSYNKSVGRKISSSAMQATAADSLSDCIATGAVLLAALVGHFTGLKIDGWCGLVVSALVIKAGVEAGLETVAPLLGKAPEPELVEEIHKIVESHQYVIGMHDLVVHDYGPGRLMISLHAEVPAEVDVMLLHDEIDNIEVELKSRLRCEAVIHMDPVIMNDPYREELMETIVGKVKEIDERITIHDFRIVSGPTHTNVVFDAVLPFDSKLTTAQAAARIGEIVRTSGENHIPVITIDRPYA